MDVPTLSVWIREHDKVHPGTNEFLMAIPEHAVRVTDLSFAALVEQLAIARVYFESEAHPGWVYAFANVQNVGGPTWSVAGGPLHPCMALVPISLQRPEFKHIT
jgi:hypothetical protein